MNSVQYQVEGSANIINWTNLSPVLTGSGSMLFFTNTAPDVGTVFYRVKRKFPAAPGTASFDPITGVLTVVADDSHHAINIANDGSGTIVVNGGAMVISGGVPTTGNTVLIQVLGSPGDDQISIGNGLAPAHIFGAEGNDTLSGGSGNDLLVGGPGQDTLTGRQGSDTVFADDGDTVVWNPGDGSDVIQGKGANNVLMFNGANINENLALSANGHRTLLTRDVGAVTLDMDGIQTVNLRTLSGTDNVTVNDLSGTAVSQVNIDLAGVFGTTNGDAVADTVIINGTSGADTFNVSSNLNAVQVTGVGAAVNVSNGEAAYDRILVNGVGSDLVNVNGGLGPDVMQITPSPVAGCVRTTVVGFSLPVDVSGALTLRVNGLDGDDSITGANGVAALGIPIVLDGGNGDDTIFGGDENDTIFGGSGNNTISGGRGNDVAFLGLGTNKFIWNPGDGNDTVEGQTGINTLQFNGANIAENISVSANGSRVLLTRDVAAITMDLNAIQFINLQMLGGADSITVNDLSGTGVSKVAVDLSSAAGLTNGDAAVDTVTVNGTSNAEVFDVAANGSAVEVSGAGEIVSVVNGELAYDRIVINGVGNDTVNVNGTSAADVMQLTPSPVSGFVRATTGAFTIPLDVAGALTLKVNGLDGDDSITAGNGLAALAVPIVLDGGNGNDTITGGDENDTIFGGGGNNTIWGGRGNDVAFLGSGTNTFTWNPGDGSDTVEGQTGTNTFVFNGANISEHIEISSNGGRVRLTRDVAAIVMDLNGIQTVNVQALGGADTVTVDDLNGTNLKKVNVDLGASGGSGDGAVDNVIVNGTASPDTINITANSGVVSVTGLAAQVDISHPEPANDVLTVNGLGGTDTFTTGAGVTSLIGVVVNQ